MEVYQLATTIAKQISRLKRKAEGKCCECGRDPIPHRTRCKRCTLQHNKDNKKLKSKYKDTHKCTTCSAELMPEEIKAGYKSCITHREGLTAGVSQWGRS
jgi:predicted RNA-binding Zn-ribbon protein involved in translation (DUF1610 family)